MREKKSFNSSSTINTYCKSHFSCSGLKKNCRSCQKKTCPFRHVWEMLISPHDLFIYFKKKKKINKIIKVFFFSPYSVSQSPPPRVGWVKCLPATLCNHIHIYILSQSCTHILSAQIYCPVASVALVLLCVAVSRGQSEGVTVRHFAGPLSGVTHVKKR